MIDVTGTSYPGRVTTFMLNLTGRSLDCTRAQMSIIVWLSNGSIRSKVGQRCAEYAVYFYNQHLRKGVIFCCCFVCLFVFGFFRIH